MTIDEARECLADYNDDPLPPTRPAFFLNPAHMILWSEDGKRFACGLWGRNGFQRFWDNPAIYQRDITLLRAEAELDDNKPPAEFWKPYDFDPIPH